jgi:heme exporter protein C
MSLVAPSPPRPQALALPPPTGTRHFIPAAKVGIVVATVVAVAAALGAIFLIAPEEATMGPAQKIVYLHVAVAWSGLCGCAVMGLAGAGYLASRREWLDRAAQAAGEVGWLCGTLTLATGSLWAHVAWGAWWTWDPRLTTMLILWVLYAGYFLTRNSIEEPRRRARVSAILALLAAADMPLIIFATRWFRGIHPVSPEMDPQMRAVLLASVGAFSCLFLLLGVVRFRQLLREDFLEHCQRQSEYESDEQNQSVESDVHVLPFTSRSSEETPSWRT